MYPVKVTFKKKLALVVVFLSLFLLPACIGSASRTPPGTAVSPAAKEVTLKPQPRVLNVNASTAGFFDDYYVILDANIRNDGAEGVIMVIASITQANNTSIKKMPVSLGKGKSQMVRFVFPIKWQGGEWTPKVTTELP